MAAESGWDPSIGAKADRDDGPGIYVRQEVVVEAIRWDGGVQTSRRIKAMGAQFDPVPGSKVGAAALWVRDGGWVAMKIGEWVVHEDGMFHVEDPWTFDRRYTAAT